MEGEGQRHLALGTLCLDLGVEMTEQTDLALIAKADAVAACKLLRRLYQRLPARAVEPLDQGRLDLRLGIAPDAAAAELRRDYLGVIDNQRIARLEPFRQVGDDRIAQNAYALHQQKPRGIARARRPQRDVFRRKLEIEEIGSHQAMLLSR
jgi:hypothetical protein